VVRAQVFSGAHLPSTGAIHRGCGCMTETFDFSKITEGWEPPVSAEQQAMASLRYGMAAKLAGSGRFLEIGCGTGYALPKIAATASVTIGVDLELENLRQARWQLPGAALLQASGECLPLQAATFDAIACLEALYLP